MLALRTFLVATVMLLLGSHVAAARAQLSGDEWTSPTYGFSVSWAGTDWEPDANAMLTAVGPEKLDRLHLINGVSSLYVEGATRYEGSLPACVETEAALLAQEAGVSNVRTFEDENGVPLIADGPNASSIAFQLTLDAGGQDLELVDYIECRVLVPGESVLIITLVAEPDNFRDQMSLAQPVIDSIEIPGGGQNSPLQAYGELLAAAQGQPSLAGPSSGEVAFGPGELGVERLGVHEADVYVRAQFAHPEPANLDLWDIGIGFRDTGEDNQFRVIVDSDGRWFFKYGLDEVIAQGRITDIETSAGGVNTIEVVTQGDTGYFAFNERLVTELDLSASDEAGDVFVGSGFFDEDAVVAGVVPFEGVEVWAVPEEHATPVPATPEPTRSAMLDGAGFASITKLAMSSPPVAGSTDGTLTQNVGTASVAGAGVSLEDFVAEVSFVNPAVAGQPWDMGIAFREQPNGDHYRLTIASDGGWRYQIGTQSPISGGALPVVNFAPGAENTITLLVDGSNAAFAVNGFFVATLDASQLSGASDVWVGSGFQRANVTPGAVTDYRDLEVWALPAAVGGMEGQAVVDPASVPERVSLRLHEVGDSGVDALGAITGDSHGATLTVVARDASGNELAALFSGSCRNLAEAPLQTLPPLDARGQTTLVMTQPIADFTATSHAVALIGAQDTVVACGDVSAGA
ncbi:MAG: hypothetical protein U0075_18550 [Thermomicrobiales bacterium]